MGGHYIREDDMRTTKTTVNRVQPQPHKAFKDIEVGGWMVSPTTGALGVKADCDTVLWMGSGQPRANQGRIDQMRAYLIPSEVDIKVTM